MALIRETQACKTVGRGLMVAVLSCGIIATAPCAARAQDFPTRPIKFIVPYPAGGITDVLPRVMQDFLTRQWGQPIVIENKPGAAGNIGAEAVAKAEPDGYTVMITAPSPLTVNQSLYPKLTFDPAEFVPVSIVATIPTGLFVNPNKIKADSVAGLIAQAKANPGKISAATQGNGSTSHLTSEWFQMVSDVKFVQVPYRGSAPALQGLLAGDVDLMFDNLGVSLQLVSNGQLKMLAVATDKRLASLPELPTIAETLPGFVSSTWVGAFLPPRTPQQIADRLSIDFIAAVRQSDIAKRFLDHACEPAGLAPQATATFVRAEAEKWTKVIKMAGIKVE
jgi:tripartite-type tricarboxylate transporter receptor subunit TctC